MYLGKKPYPKKGCLEYSQLPLLHPKNHTYSEEKRRQKGKYANAIPLGPFSFSSPSRIEPSLVKVTELPFQVMSVPWFK